MPKHHDLIDLEMVMLSSTEKAIFVSDTGESNRGVWLPKSQVEYSFENPKHPEHVTVTCPEWLARDKGLI